MTPLRFSFILVFLCTRREHSLRHPRLPLPSRLFVDLWNAHVNMLLITAQPIRNLRTPVSADMNKRGFLEQASPPPLPNPPPLFPFLPIPYPLPLSTPATQAKTACASTVDSDKVVSFFLIQTLAKVGSAGRLTFSPAQLFSIHGFQTVF